MTSGTQADGSRRRALAQPGNTLPTGNQGRQEFPFNTYAGSSHTEDS
jgi:hypothetical protein